MSTTRPFPPAAGPNSGAYEGTTGIFCTIPMKVFLCPSDGSAINGMTQFQNINNKQYDDASNYAHNIALYTTFTAAKLDYLSTKYTIANVPDGTSNTLSFVEKIANCGSPPKAYSARDLPTQSRGGANCSAVGGEIATGGAAAAVTLPEIGVNQNTCKGAGGATSPHTGVMVTGLLDGSVHLMSSSISKQTYWDLMNPADGLVLGSDW